MRSFGLAPTSAAFAIVISVVGCSSSTNGTGGDGGVGAHGGDGGASSGPALSCGQILDCIVKCPDSDTACPDACGAKGTPDGQQKVLALAGCIDKGACKDADCTRTKCEAEVTACLQPTGGGTPISDGGAPAAGSVPPELVGKWVSSLVLYEFKADGTVGRALNATTGSCHSTSAENGIAVASGNGTLSIYFTSGLFKICGGAPKDPYVAKQEDFTYTIKPGAGVQGEDELRLVQLQCKYTDPSSMALYCSDAVYRQ